MKRLVWITVVAAGVSAGCVSIDLPAEVSPPHNHNRKLWGYED